jgi:hypothetical protein
VTDDVDGVNREDHGIGFLDMVWGRRRGWVSLSAKVNGYWAERNYLWPDQRRGITQMLSRAVIDGEDTYFSPVQFRRKGRREENALSSAWLFADLDNVTPQACGQAGLWPTVSWESSPGRFQALWRLDDGRLKRRVHGRVNRALTTMLGADASGWDITQVLRVPGTVNFKREIPHHIMVVGRGDGYSARGIWHVVRGYARVDGADSEVGVGEEGRAAVGLGSGEMPARARVLLRANSATIVVGERSARLWELECLLAEAGWKEDEIFRVVERSAWYEHWRERGSGSTAERGCRREIRKAIAHVRTKGRREGSSGGRQGSDSSADTRVTEPRPGEDAGSAGRNGKVVERGDESGGLPLEGYGRFLSRDLEAPRWLISEIWTSSSHGIIGGEPKTSKSLLALAMGLSVASGKPWMGKYDVLTTGPVLMIQEENVPWMVQDRLRKLSRFYGLIGKGDWKEEKPRHGDVAKRIHIQFPRDLDFWVVNNRGTNLLNEADREAIEKTVVERQPRMLILDPLYLILGAGDISSERDLRPVLQWLLYLRFTYDLAVVVVHHFKKAATDDAGNSVRPGQRLLGSMTLHAWLESALYTTAQDSERGMMRTLIHREFRNVGPRAALKMTARLGEPGSLSMEANVSPASRTAEIADYLRHQADKEHRTFAVARALRADKRTVISVCKKLEADGDVVMKRQGSRGWYVQWKAE